MTDKYIALSGGFDPIHPGHIRMINDASCFGKVIVLLNSDAWLSRKKGKPFMCFEQRKEVLEAVRNVYCVLPAIDDDGTVCKSLTDLKFIISYFGNGGDRNENNTPEDKLCERNETPIIYGLGGGKIASSSDMAKAVSSV